MTKIHNDTLILLINVHTPYSLGPSSWSGHIEGSLDRAGTDSVDDRLGWGSITSCPSMSSCGDISFFNQSSWEGI